ncbi:hypothetical protein I6U48_14130 [Clostridium sp. PL3]|uniref:Uncharacterized protein n=1 Tax=Clostridium thailandense TaxID=2794346 RepID=A0A949WRI7_9CLOT|nr:hypothetical protein [Clostridium thailandense]MBV7274041.1 hypothetical protein [Clostridium thailandense]
MEFISKGFSSVFKIILAIAAVIIFIKSIPLLIFVGAAIYGGSKLMKYIKKNNGEKIHKKEKNNTKSEIYEEQNYYDLSNKKVIDVEYEEIKRN